MNAIIKDHLSEIHQLCLSHHVTKLYAFGSVVSGEFKESSDVDFLVSFDNMDPEDYADNYFQLAGQLEHVLNRPVDLVTENSLGNQYFIRSVNRSKLQIYG